MQLIITQLLFSLHVYWPTDPGLKGLLAYDFAKLRRRKNDYKLTAMEQEDAATERTGNEENITAATPPEEPRKKITPKHIIALVLVMALFVAIGALIWASSTTDETANQVAAPSNIEQSNNEETNSQTSAAKYPVVDTNQLICFGSSTQIECPEVSGSFFGQDAQYQGNAPSYTNNNDGTITDNVTGLMWQKTPGEKSTYSKAISAADSFSLAGYDDWRAPSIKELYSLMDFSGEDIDPMSTNTSDLNPFINSDVFAFEYGDTASGSRIIDSQWVTSNKYVSTVMNNQECFFGVNFADGRIKCYPTVSNQNQGYFVRYVRGDSYGQNSYTKNGDGTISDAATELVWQQADSAEGLTWSEALNYCQDLSLGDYSWRLPNAKELHSIVDYGRSPDTTSSPAIDPIFTTTSITNEANNNDWPFFWTSTTHKSQMVGVAAVYISFGRAMGNMTEFGGWIDVHGAGAQRSDPKEGDPAQYSDGRGPQGDAVHIDNYVRCVSDLP